MMFTEREQLTKMNTMKKILLLITDLILLPIILILYRKLD